MKTIIFGMLLIFMIVGMTSCAMVYQSAPYEEQLWELARTYGYGQVFHTHITGYGMCATVLVSGTGTNRFSAETNAYRRGAKFFNPSIGNVPLFGDVIINKREVVTIKKKLFKMGDDDWRVDSIVVSPLSPHGHHQ